MTRTRVVPHGTTTGYSHYKCRCQECRAAVAEYGRKRKAAMREGTWNPDPAKGRPTRQMCVGPECDLLARYVTPMPLCMTHKQQLDRGKSLTPRRRIRRVIDGMKECSRCGLTKPVEAYAHSAGKIQAHCLECQSVVNRMRLYGLTADEVKNLMDDACAGCGTSESLHVDHDHETGKVRGVLCHHCNTVLHERMTPATLRRLADYLEASS